MEMTINIQLQQVVNELEQAFLTDDITMAERYKHNVMCFLRSVNKEFAMEANKLLLQTEGYKNAIELKIKKG